MPSCSVDEEDPVTIDLLIGEWDATEYAKYLNPAQIVYFQQYPIEILEKNAQGISLMENGKFCHRSLDKTNGWHTCSGGNSSGTWTWDKQDSKIVFNLLPDNTIVEADIIDYTKNSLWLGYYIEPYYFEYKFRRH